MMLSTQKANQGLLVVMQDLNEFKGFMQRVSYTRWVFLKHLPQAIVAGTHFDPEQPSFLPKDAKVLCSADSSFSAQSAFALRLSLQMLQGLYQVVSLHSCALTLLLVPIALAAKLSGCRVIYNMHDVVPETGKRYRKGMSSIVVNFVAWGALLVEWSLVHLADLVVFPGMSYLDTVAGRYPDQRKKMEIVSNIPWVLGPRANTDSQYRDLRARYGLPHNACLIVFVGGVSRNVHGVELIIQAQSLLRNETPPVYSIIVGKGINRQEKEYFDDLVASLNIDDRVFFLGQLPHWEAMTVLQQGDLAILVEFDGPTHKFFEYLRFGLVPIMWKGMTHHSQVAGDSAVYFKDLAPSSVAGAVRVVLEDLETHKQEARKRAEKTTFDPISAHAPLFAALEKWLA